MLLRASRKEGGYGDGWGQWQTVWHEFCHHSATEKMTLFSVQCSNFIEGHCMEEKGRGSFLHITSWVPPIHPPLEPTALWHTASQLSEQDSPLNPSRAEVQLPDLCTSWLPSWWTTSMRLLQAEFYLPLHEANCTSSWLQPPSLK